MNGAILEWTKERGYHIAWGAPSLLDEVRAEMDKRFHAGEMDERVFRHYVSKFSYMDGLDLKEAGAVGVVAVPRPAHVVTFRTVHGPFHTILPPTYVGYTRTIKEVIREMSARVSPLGYRVMPLFAPLKLLAAKLRLTRYGRNNIVYVPGLGSYHQLVGFVTDEKPESAIEPQTVGNDASLLKRCARCTACRKTCPTGAISDESFVLHAGRCLTLWNESREPWPQWIHETSHNCLLGCLACQRVCPENRGLLRFEQVQDEFTVEETEALLGGDMSENVRDRVLAKITSLGLWDYEPLIGRNLRALLQATSLATVAGEGELAGVLPPYSVD